MKPTVLDRDRAIDAKAVREIVTPEGIPIRFKLARVGDRVGAFLIDSTIQMGTLMLLALVFSLIGAGQGVATAFLQIAIFITFQFYFVFFEVRWQGSTPGKRRIGIRVIDARGGQLEVRAVLARNFVRQLEVMVPLSMVFGRVSTWGGLFASAWAFVCLLFPLFNRDRLRLGDLIAGTRVVEYPKAALMPDLVAERPSAGFPFTDAQLGVYGIYELQVLEGVLRRAPGEPGHAEAVATVAGKICQKIGFALPVVDHDRFLRDFYAALRAYLEQRMLFGQRREDKHARP